MKKLTSEKGFSLSEMLMAVLILTLTMSFIGGSIYVVKNSYEKITLRTEAQVLLSTLVVSISDELKWAKEIERKEIDQQEYLSFYHTKKGYRMYLYNGEDNIYSKIEISGTELPIITDKTITNGLLPQIEDLKYENEVFTYYIRIYYQDEVYEEQEISIRPLNEGA